MNIINSFIRSKYKNNLKCEDGIYHDENFVVLIDGTTSKGTLKWNGKTSGEYTKDIILDDFTDMPRDISKLDIFTRLNKLLVNEMSKIPNIKEKKVEWLRASIIIYSKHYKKIWSYGDCQLMINDTLLSKTKAIDLLIADIRSKVLKVYYGDSIHHEILEDDIGREFIKPLLIKQLDYENEKGDFGYATLNGFTFNEELIQEFEVNVDDEIVFASDGYPKLFNSLDESEKELKRLLNEDPNCMYLNKQTKSLVLEKISFDDRSYIKFKLIDLYFE